MRFAASSKQGGISAIEGVVCISFLASLICSVFVVVDYLWVNGLVTRVVDDCLYNNALKPIGITVQQGGVATGVRHQEIRSQIEKSAQQAAAVLHEDFELTTRGGYVVEATYRVVDVDPRSGGVTKINDPGFSTRRTSVAKIDQYKDMSQLWRSEFSQAIGDRDNGMENASASAAAMPRGGYGIAGADQFLPQVVLIGCGATVSYPDGFSNWVRTMVDLSSSITAVKVVMLRGGME